MGGGGFNPPPSPSGCTVHVDGNNVQTTPLYPSSLPSDADAAPVTTRQANVAINNFFSNFTGLFLIGGVLITQGFNLIPDSSPTTKFVQRRCNYTYLLVDNKKICG